MRQKSFRRWAGKKLHGKRNHINKFKSLYEDWNYETLSDDNVEGMLSDGVEVAESERL